MKNIEIPAGMEGLVEKAADWGVRIAGVLFALLVAWVIAGWVRRKIVTLCERRNIDTTLARFFSNSARYAVLAGAVLGCLGVFGIETSSFAALIAAMGLAIGLAFQGTLSNFAAGAMLLIFRPFKVGDVIRAGGEVGSVVELELFSTELATPDNRRLIIPNSKIFGDTIENVSHHKTRRVEVAVGIDYGADIKESRDVLLKAAAAVKGVLSDPEPAAILAGLGDSALDWKIRVWVNSEDYWPVSDALTVAVKESLDAAKIGIPYPQMDIHQDK